MTKEKPPERVDGLCTTCGGALDARAVLFQAGGGCCSTCVCDYRGARALPGSRGSYRTRSRRRVEVVADPPAHEYPDGHEE